MEITNELIAKFFRQECTPEESKFINDYFDQHPDALDGYMTEDDWQNFEAEDKLHPAVSQKMLQNIQDKIEVPRRIHKLNFKTLMAAASVVVIIGAGLFIAQQLIRSNKQETAYRSAVNSSSQTNDTVINKTDKELAVALPDGSEVVLSAKSWFSYNKIFKQKHRDIYLSGEAVFKVAKDKTRPFTVYASGLATTALGTRFRVSAFSGDNRFSVKLYEGKVVIKHTKPVKSVADSDVYLTPGHELLWNNSIKESRVIVFNNITQPATLLIQGNDVKEAKSFVKFNNERLADVFDQLQQLYHIRIKVTAGNLDNKFFTSTVNSRKETADDILHRLKHFPAGFLQCQ